MHSMVRFILTINPLSKEGSLPSPGLQGFGLTESSFHDQSQAIDGQ